MDRDVLDGRVVLSQRLRLTREAWAQTVRPQVSLTGVEPCLELFGAG